MTIFIYDYKNVIVTFKLFNNYIVQVIFLREWELVKRIKLHNICQIKITKCYRQMINLMNHITIS